MIIYLFWPKSAPLLHHRVAFEGLYAVEDLVSIGGKVLMAKKKFDFGISEPADMLAF